MEWKFRIGGGELGLERRDVSKKGWGFMNFYRFFILRRCLFVVVLVFF